MFYTGDGSSNRPHDLILVTLFLFLLPAVLHAQDGNNQGGNGNGAAKQKTLVYEQGRLVDEKKNEVTIIYRVGHGRGSLLKRILKPWLSDDGRIVATESLSQKVANQLNYDHVSGLHLLLVTDKKDNIGRLEKIINILDKPIPQVTIRALIVERLIEDGMQLGVEASWTETDNTGPDTKTKSVTQTFNPSDFLTTGASPFQGSTFGFTDGPDGSNITQSLSVDVRALLRRGNSEVLSRPFVSVNSGEEAVITSGTKVPIPSVTILPSGNERVSTDLKDVDIELKVTPHIVGEDHIHLSVKPKVEGVLRNIDIQGVPTPIISSREAHAEVTVRSGQQIVLGGLKRTEKNESVRGIPLLMDIPGLGYLFKRHEEDTTETELLFILKPDIKTGPKATGGIPKIIEPDIEAPPSGTEED